MPVLLLILSGIVVLLAIVSIIFIMRLSEEDTPYHISSVPTGKTLRRVPCITSKVTRVVLLCPSIIHPAAASMC